MIYHISTKLLQHFLHMELRYNFYNFIMSQRQDNFYLNVLSREIESGLSKVELRVRQVACPTFDPSELSQAPLARAQDRTKAKLGFLNQTSAHSSSKRPKMIKRLLLQTNNKIYFTFTDRTNKNKIGIIVRLIMFGHINLSSLNVQL